ncbi:MAG: transporter substrate-binding domain-containing protein [Methylococcales bacterium]|nr:transporter substrate-binding domain-containing protein [Methylococcales bacterium]MBT7442858.1 transporter substrate-binding domain-containing protein [Methylococcales bacterium]
MHPFRHLLLILLLSFISNPLLATEFRVGIKPSEPWVMFDQNLAEAERKPKGFSIDLWQAIAQRLGIQTHWVYFNTTNEIISATEHKDIDVGIAAITIMAEREEKIDFSTSMYELGLQIMVTPSQQSSNPIAVLFSELSKLLSVKIVLIFAAMLILTAHCRLWIDRLNPEPVFPRSYWKGTNEAIWWGLTMLLTWETPKSKGIARTIDLSWHLIGLISLSILTAVVTATLTQKAVQGTIQTEADLKNRLVAAVESDAPRRYLEKMGIEVQPVADLQAGMALLKAGKVEALVHDGPRLVYLANKANQQAKQTIFHVLPVLFNRQNYGIVTQPGSDWVEKINQKLLHLREAEASSESFHQTLTKKCLNSSHKCMTG